MSEQERNVPPAGDEMIGPEPGLTSQPPVEALDAAAAETPVSAAAALEAADVSNDDRLMAALAWLTLVIIQLPVLSVVLLLVEPNKTRPFQRYHAVTSTIFWVVALVYEALATIVFITLSLISLGCLAACVWLIFFVPHVIALYYALQAYNGKFVVIPVVSDFARRQGWA